MKRCMGLTGLIFGHNFVARYSYGAPTMDGESRRADKLIELIKASRPAKYIHDVCDRCGMIIEVKP